MANSQGGQQLQCYACGLPKVHPEYDVVGSYGLKKYNHSCEEMLDSKKNNNQIDQAFIRTCPVGVKSCFGATGFYDHKDNDKTNDICKHSFLTCYVNIVHCKYLQFLIVSSFHCSFVVWFTFNTIYSPM